MELYVKYLPSFPFREKMVPEHREFLEKLPQPRPDDGFERFAIDLRALDAADNVPVLVIPTFLYFIPPDSYPWKTKEDHFKFTKLQVALWILQDDSFNKPVHLDGVSSIDELRLISGLGPQFESVTINWTGQETNLDEYEANLRKWVEAAGDER